MLLCHLLQFSEHFRSLFVTTPSVDWQSTAVSTRRWLFGCVFMCLPASISPELHVWNCRWTDGISTRKRDNRSNHESQNADAQGTRAPTSTLYDALWTSRRRSTLSTVINLRYWVTCIANSWPLFTNMTSSIKPEVHNVSQRRQRRTDRATPIGNVHKKNWWRWDVYSSGDMLMDRQTRSSQYSAPPPTGGRVLAMPSHPLVVWALAS